MTNGLCVLTATAHGWTLTPAFDLNPNASNVLIALNWLGSAEIPRQFSALLRLAEIGGIPATAARELYDQVEAETLGGWRQVWWSAGDPLRF